LRDSLAQEDKTEVTRLQTKPIPITGPLDMIGWHSLLTAGVKVRCIPSTDVCVSFLPDSSIALRMWTCLIAGRPSPPDAFSAMLNIASALVSGWTACTGFVKGRCASTSPGFRRVRVAEAFDSPFTASWFEGEE
jgi:hypothetical protein